MRLLQSELTKLALHSDSLIIERAQVEQLVARAREEEFLELSDALQKRDLKVALRYVDDALGQAAPPLMLLGAISSILRGLVVHKERLKQLAQERPLRSFDEFKARLFPTIEKEAKATSEKPPHPYAAFLGMQAAARFERSELKEAWLACADADLALKSSGKWQACARAAALSDMQPRTRLKSVNLRPHEGSKLL